MVVLFELVEVIWVCIREIPITLAMVGRSGYVWTRPTQFESLPAQEQLLLFPTESRASSLPNLLFFVWLRAFFAINP